MTKILPNKGTIIDEYKTHPSDTGSCFVQVALLSERMKEISKHLETHKKDFDARRSLLMIVAQRRRFLKYIKNHFFDMYEPLMKKLGIKIKK